VTFSLKHRKHGHIHAGSEGVKARPPAFLTSVSRSIFFSGVQLLPQPPRR